MTPDGTKKQKYLSGFTNFLPNERDRADQIKASDMIEKWENDDGSVTVNYLQQTPVDHGQREWIGRNSQEKFLRIT